MRALFSAFSLQKVPSKEYIEMQVVQFVSGDEASFPSMRDVNYIEHQNNFLNIFLKDLSISQCAFCFLQ